MAAVLVAAHGSKNDPAGRAACLRLLEALRALGAFSQLRAAFWRERPSWSEALAPLTDPEVYVVPFFFAQGYFVREVLPRELRPRPGQRVTLCEPLGISPQVTALLAERARAALPDPGRGAVVLLGHGSGRSATSTASVEEHARGLRALGEFGEVVAVYTDAEPQVGKTWSLVRAAEVVLVPVMASDGFHAGGTARADLGLGAEQGLGGPHAHEGRRVWLAQAVGEDPAMLEVALGALRASGWSGERGVERRPLVFGGARGA
jgi:sirohydrochlorin cobaltochelatase